MNINQPAAINCIKKHKLSEEQIQIYKWLKEQNINTDDGTLMLLGKNL